VDLTTGGSLGGDDERIKEKRERGERHVDLTTGGWYGL
jgi:hypothetical protein